MVNSDTAIITVATSPTDPHHCVFDICLVHSSKIQLPLWVLLNLCVRKYLLQLGKREASILFYGSTHYNHVMSSCHIYGIIIFNRCKFAEKHLDLHELLMFLAQEQSK